MLGVAGLCKRPVGTRGGAMAGVMLGFVAGPATSMGKARWKTLVNDMA